LKSRSQSFPSHKLSTFCTGTGYKFSKDNLKTNFTNIQTETELKNSIELSSYGDEVIFKTGSNNVFNLHSVFYHLVEILCWIYWISPYRYLVSPYFTSWRTKYYHAFQDKRTFVLLFDKCWKNCLNIVRRCFLIKNIFNRKKQLKTSEA